LATSSQIFGDIFGTFPATAGYYRDPEGTVYEVDDLGFVSVFDSGACPTCISAYRVLKGNAMMTSLDSNNGTQINTFGGVNPLDILVQQADGKIVAARQMVRYNFDGTVDASFNNSGIANGIIYGATKIGSNYYFAGAFTISKGFTVNKIAAVDNSGNYVNMTSRGTGFGAAVTQMSLTGYAGSLYVYRNTTGSTTYNGAPCQNIVKMNTNGLITTQFNIGTSNVTVGTKPVFDSVGNMYVLIGGTSNTIVKFSPSGVELAAVVLGSPAARSIVIDSADRIYLCGTNLFFIGGVSTGKTMIRLNSSLVYDASFEITLKGWRAMFLEDDATMYAVYIQSGETGGRVNKINLTTETIDPTFVSPVNGSNTETFSLNAYTFV
jgi:hypothetical protein